MDMIDLRYVKKLIDMLDSSTVDSIEISSDKGMKLRLSKTGLQRVGGVGGGIPITTPIFAPIAPQLPVAANDFPGNGGGAAIASPVGATPGPATRTNYLEVKSPMVGTFYASPEPGAKPYIPIGTRIQKGQVLCIIEAMKIMNEIESEYAGTVVEVLVDDAHPVEYGQVLFRIDPNG